MASGIIRFIKKVCVQTAVYWPAPVTDGFGGMTYGTAVEIKCRWTDKVQVVKWQSAYVPTSNEFISYAEVLVVDDVVLQGVLWLGELDDLSTAQKSSPLTILGAREIKTFERIPLFRSSTEFVKKVYL
ncbi:MAG: hypothetical protein EOM62_14225, partial [Bacteroidia bacterium]|nr:hypothetical protein [Bacteroidia bacterium]